MKKNEKVNNEFDMKNKKIVRIKETNQSPKGKMWSAVPLPCFDIFMSEP